MLPLSKLKKALGSRMVRPAGGVDKWPGRCFVDLQEFTAQLHQVLAEYETGDRGPQRAIEVITSLFNGFDKSPEPLPAAIEKIRMVVDAWDQKDRSDVDVLATISAMARQLQGTP